MIKKLKPAIKKALKPSLKPRTIVEEPTLHLEVIPEPDASSYHIMSLGYVILATVIVLAAALYLIWYPAI